jgi:hypothetical protein
VFVGIVPDLADLMAAWAGAGMDGFRLRPAMLPDDLSVICEQLVPELQRRSLFRAAYDTGTLRARFGLGRPANRYASVQGVG